MKKILFGLLLACSFMAKAQVYNNEWIDYSKTYYKFKVGRDGVYRIPFSLLNSVGLGTTPAEHFQLWRNGTQVPIYTSVAAGALPTNGYIEFWGKMNDGKPDKQLYRKPSYQLNDKWSLLTDTATYFLTVNTVVSSNLRLESTANNVAGNTLPVEPYFMYTAGNYFRNKFNDGYAVPVGANLYSSSYDKGEGWTSVDIVSTAKDSVTVTYGTHTSSLTNLFVYTGGPQPSFKISVSGNAVNQRRYKVAINGDSVLGKQVDFYELSTDSATFPLSKILTNTASVTVSNLAYVGCYFKDSVSGYTCQTDRMVIHKYELTYPRQFNFGGAMNFEFSLPATPVGNYLEITNFSSGTTTPPVLYDLTNGKRYVADMSTPSKLKFALLPSSENRDLVLVREDATNVKDIAALETRRFIDYSANGGNAGDYLIISNPFLFGGSGGSNPVEDYRAYRSSVAGGAHNAKIYLADELIDQYAFGIKKHPLGIRNFLRYARLNYPVKPRHVFLLGRGVNYRHQYTNESSSNPTVKDNLAKLNLVPTFGWPASDVLLTAEPGSSVPEIPIGRLSVITPQEVVDYLNKVKEFEMAQAASSPSSERKWMKNVAHIVGASDEDLGNTLTQAMNGFKNIIADSLFGANVSTFSKQSADAVEQLNSSALSDLFTQGLSLITYFGHSSASTLEFNLDNPENYNNQGKYPVFIALGCNAGDFFNYNATRFVSKETISEKYNLSPNRGTIGFIASSHFGIVHYLDIWNAHAYKRISGTSYGNTLGEIMKGTAEDVFRDQSQEDFYARATVEETALHGDPAITLNPHPKPDYVIEDPMVKTSPGFISVADESFSVSAKIFNLGKASNDKIVVEVKRQFPDQSIAIVQRNTIQGLKYVDSITVVIPVDPVQHKGLNKIIVTVDADNDVDELYEINNSVTKEVMIYEDEARPIYPYNFAIINKPSVKLVASTANPFAPSKRYRMELDTTELFNSPFKISQTLTTVGGVMEFNPAINFTDSTVYYWRVAPVPDSGPVSWNMASFVYFAASDLGFNQSHLHQHEKSNLDRIVLDTINRAWKIKPVLNELFIKNGAWITATGQEGDLVVNVNGGSYIRTVCNFGIIINVFDKNTFKAWRNREVNGQGLYGSRSSACAPSRNYNFEFNNDTAGRRKAMEFLRFVVPNDNYVVVRVVLNGNSSANELVDKWKADEAIYGTGKTLYSELKNSGLTVVDSFYKLRVFAGVYKKGNSDFEVYQRASKDQYDVMALAAYCPSNDSLGFVTSPQFGPAKKWKTAKWKGNAGLSNRSAMKLIGIEVNGSIDTLRTDIDIAQGVLDISFVDPVKYPYLKLQLKTFDTTTYTPYQLINWQLTYDPAPEGAIAPNVYFEMKDTVDVAEPQNFRIAFKNVSEASFADSITIKAVVTDKNNVTTVLPEWKQRPLFLNPDTLIVTYPIDTKQLVGSNSIVVEVNPDNRQPEQYHFNNFFYKNFYVRPDTLNPLLDVTFDNAHILNRDIVSARPDILIKLKDESKWFLLDDTSTINVQVRFPDGSLKTYAVDGTIMKYTPPQQAPASDNTATVNLKPIFDQDGDYELLVKGKDMSQNKTGSIEYRVAFQVFNKPMISNMLNYPNPFTTSTAFVFTVTGSEVPQNIRIQILTVTGKVVREITKGELGPLRVGRNITEFKWDGTDQYGQKLANGIYLYRVITNLNGKSLDKFKGENDNTDKYFNKGYGKMYLMR